METPTVARWVLCCAFGGCAHEGSAPNAADGDTGASAVQVAATAETPSSGGDPDDAAIWVHPADPALSRILTTDKDKGLFVYNLAGEQVQKLEGFQLNNIDVRYAIPLGDGSVDLAVATDRADDTLALFAIDRQTGEISVANGSGIPVATTGPFPVYGGCLYHPTSGELYAFVNTKGGAFKQLLLADDGNGRFTARELRVFGVDSQPEGCAVDDEFGVLYLGEEGGGLHRIDAAPHESGVPVLIDGIGTGHLTPDVEGVALYAAQDGGGYVLVSSQGNDTIAVYERGGDNVYVGSFRVTAGAFDEVTHTDGIDVTHAALGDRFPEGMVVLQDDRDDRNGKSAFKFVPWQAIAQAFEPALIIDPSTPLRR